MYRMIYDYTKSMLEKVSFDVRLFTRELRKALNKLLPYEIENLKKWLIYFTNDKPDLKSCVSLVILR